MADDTIMGIPNGKTVRRRGERFLNKLVILFSLGLGMNY